VETPELFWIVAVLAAFLVGAGKGGMPMVAMLSVPLLSLVMPPMLGAVLLLPVYLISDVVGLYLYRRDYSARNLAILIPAGAIGIAIGYGLAGRISDDAVRVIVGGVGLGFLALRLAGRWRGRAEARHADVPRGLFWGALAGFTSFVSHAGAPPFQVYALPQNLPKMVFAGTSTILFAAINLMKVPPYLALGLIGWSDARTIAILTPVAVLGAWLGYRLIRVVPERIFFAFVEIALFVISVNLIRVGLMPG
jgi:uncharacterized membrane protein YfcA